MSLYFVMNIATTTGFPEMIVYNDFEKLLEILFVYLGVAMFAFAFGLFAANTAKLPEKFVDVFDRLRKMQSILETGQVKHQLRNKIENYFAYIVDTRGENEVCLDALKGLLSSNSVILKGLHLNFS